MQMKTIWKIFLNSILILFVLVGVILVFSILPIKGNYKIFSVMSGSMEPKLPVGSLILVKPTNVYEKGDIITYKSTQKKNDFTTHRIHEIKEENGIRSYVTKGDANNDPDFEHVTGDRVVGKERAVVALLGYPLWFVKTLPGLIILIIIPALIIIYDEVDKIKKEIQNIKISKLKKSQKGKKNGKTKRI